MDYNTILDTDSYKTSHGPQFPPKTEKLYSHFEARGTDTNIKSTVFFGLQYIIKKFLKTPITQAHVEEAAEFCKNHGVPFNREGWEYILQEYNGYIPVRIKAVKEGTVVPLKNTLMTIESTDPKVFWVGSYLETMLVRVWYPITVATISWHVKQVIMRSLDKTSDDPSEIYFKLHDFGARGVSSLESSEIGGAAHLVNFKGSDTIMGVRCANKYYNEPMSAFSIPASEHDTMTAWTRDNELGAYDNMLETYHSNGIFAMVLDSYNIWNAIDNIIGGPLKQKIIDTEAVVVIRPDSGDPVEVVLKCLQKLEAIFGSTANSKGYRILNNNVRVIQGDGCTPQMVENILMVINNNGYSTTNVAFGMGGGLLQKLNRDTFKFALKGAMVTIDGEDVEIWKSPIDDKVKVSKKGYQSLILENGEYKTVNVKDHPDDLLEVVYENGKILREQTLEEIRNLSEQKKEVLI